MVTAIPTLLSGEIPDATKWSTILSFLPRYAVKTSNDSRTTTTYTADSHLSISVPTADTYQFELMLLYDGPTGGTNGRLKVRINFPTTGGGSLFLGKISGKDTTAVTTADMTDMNVGTVFNATTSPTADINLPTVGTAANAMLTVMMYGILLANASGTLSIDTAQIVASGTTTIHTGSYLKLQRCGV